MNKDIQLWVGAASVAASLTIVAWTLVTARPNQAMRRNLLTGALEIQDLHQLKLQQSAGARVLRPGLASVAGAVRRLTPLSLVEGLQSKLRLAGLAGRWPVEKVLMAKLILGALGLMYGLLQLSKGGTMGLLLFFGAPTLAFFMPDMLISSKGSRRQEAMQRDLPDFLDQVLVTVEAGLAFESALTRVADRDRGPLGVEFRRVMQDMKLGASRRDSLERLYDRTTVPELQQFLGALKQADRYGIPIGKILRVQAGELRQRRAQRAEEKAQKIPVKIIFPVMLCFLPALFIAIMGPAILNVMENL